MRRLFLIVLLTLMTLPPMAMAEERPRAGLMWNRSGLPATLPLQIKTLPGQDYVVYLIDADNDQPVMAGYVHGGRFFRLLVPPGSWLLRFAHGTDWRGEDSLFGPDTQWTQMDAPLEFGATVAQRRGHVVTLIEQNGTMRVADARDQTICQIASWTGTRHGWDGVNREIASLLAGNGLGEFWGELRYLELDMELRQMMCG